MIGEPSTSCSEFTAPITATLGFRHDESTYDISYAPTPAKAAVPPPANSSDKTAAILSEIVQVKGPDIKKTHSYKGQVCTMMDGLKNLLGNKKKMKISMPYDAVHVNHIHFDDGSKRWLWGGGCPDAMTLLSDMQQDLLATFIRRLYAELEITWDTTRQQNNDNENDNGMVTEQVGSLDLTEVALRVQQNCKMEDPRDSYQGWGRIGEGASGIVYKGVNHRGSTVAIKRIRLHQHPRHDLLLNEIMVAKSPGCHVNIIQHIESYLWRDCIWIVMEYMDGGNLTDIVTSRTMFESEMATVCREILQGLAHLHSNRIIHRDIKSDNILINNKGHIKLSDFGFCARLDRHRQWRNTIAGTPCWMAPEIVANEPYGCKVDIWSFGVTLIEMIERQPPHFDNPERAATMLRLKQRPSLQHPERLTPALRHFLYRCFEIDPRLRASAHELGQHDFLDSAGPIDALLPMANYSMDFAFAP